MLYVVLLLLYLLKHYLARERVYTWYDLLFTDSSTLSVLDE